MHQCGSLTLEQCGASLLCHVIVPWIRCAVARVRRALKAAPPTPRACLCSLAKKRQPSCSLKHMRIAFSCRPGWRAIKSVHVINPYPALLDMNRIRAGSLVLKALERIASEVMRQAVSLPLMYTYYRSARSSVVSTCPRISVCAAVSVHGSKLRQEVNAVSSAASVNLQRCCTQWRPAHEGHILPRSATACACRSG